MRAVPLWVALGIALGLALGPVIDGTGQTTWAASGATSTRNPTASTGNFNTPSRVTSDRGACTTADTNAAVGGPGEVQTFRSFGFSATDIPASSTIDGITIKLVADISGNSNNIHTFTLQLVNASGTPAGSQVTVPPSGNLTTAKTLYTVGGPADTWGAGLDRAAILDPDFGVWVRSNISGGNRENRLFCLNVIVNYTTNPVVIAKDGSTFATTINGALTAGTIGKGEVAYAGRISVRNEHANQGATYSVTSSGATSTNASFRDALQVGIAARGDAACPQDPGGSGNTVVVPANTAYANGTGLNITTPRALSAGATEHLCYYFSLPANTPDTAAGGSIAFSLVFNATLSGVN